MKRRLLTAIILGMTTLFVGCGSKVSEAYKDYISQAKVEIVNGDYDKALQFLTLAKDENTGDKLVDELSEQIAMYRKLEQWIWAAEDGNLTEDLYESIEKQLEEANKFVKRKFESNLMIEKIKIKIEDLSFAVENEKEMKQQALEEDKELDKLKKSFYKAIENDETENIIEVGKKIKDKIYEIKQSRGETLFRVQNPKLEEEVEMYIKTAEEELLLKEEKEKNPKYYENLFSLMKDDIEQSGGEIFREYLIQESNRSTYCVHILISDESVIGLIRNVVYKIDATDNKIPEYFNKEDIQTGEVTRINLN